MGLEDTNTGTGLNDDTWTGNGLEVNMGSGTGLSMKTDIDIRLEN